MTEARHEAVFVAIEPVFGRQEEGTTEHTDP